MTELKLENIKLKQENESLKERHNEVVNLCKDVKEKLYELTRSSYLFYMEEDTEEEVEDAFKQIGAIHKILDKVV